MAECRSPRASGWAASLQMSLDVDGDTPGAEALLVWLRRFSRCRLAVRWRALIGGDGGPLIHGQRSLDLAPASTRPGPPAARDLYLGYPIDVWERGSIFHAAETHTQS
jgi:hypothetical protein